MCIPVASVGLNPLLPKNPAATLRLGTSASSVLPAVVVPFVPQGKKRRIPSGQRPLTEFRSSVSCTCPRLPPSEKWPRRAICELTLALLQCWPGWKGAAPLGFLGPPGHARLPGVAVLGHSLPLQ